MLANLRLVLRSLGKSPGFTAIAVLTLALGIGLSTSSFSMANTFLLRNLPYPEPQRLVQVFATSNQTNSGAHTPGAALALREAASCFTEAALFHGGGLALAEPGKPAEQVQALFATASFFKLIGVAPVLGRGFSPDEDAPDKPLVAVITQRAWKNRYGSDANVIGRTVRLDTQTFTIVGVLPASFDAPLVWGPVEYVVARTIHPSFRTEFRGNWMQLIGRLKPGVSIARAESELATLAARLAHEHPAELSGTSVRVTSLRDASMDSVSRGLLWLMTAISLAMLLIACANLASLQVARAFARQRDFAVRAALGGSRTQLMKPLLLESILLALAGGIGGIFVAAWANDIIGSLLVISGDLGFKIGIDGTVLMFALIASLVSGVAFGIAPSLLASRVGGGEALKDSSRSTTATRSHQRWKNGLIVAEVALALAVVGVAAMFGIGSKTFLHRHVGWDIDGIFGGFIALPYNRYAQDSETRTFHRKLLEKLTAIPGVDHVAIATSLPVFGSGENTRFAVEGEAPAEKGREPIAEVAYTSADYFSALKIPVVAGTVYSDRSSEKDPLVAVVNGAFARQYWSDGNAVGRRIKLFPDGRWLQIVGVVGDVKTIGRMTAPETRLQVYCPILQYASRYVTIVARTTLDPDALTKPVREAVAAVDSDIPVSSAGAARAMLERNLANLNLVVANLGISAGMGLLIASIGLFGVVSQLTIQRTREIGVRVALGAEPRQIVWLILRTGTKLLGIGILLGIPGFFIVGHVLGQIMPEMQLPGMWLLAANVAVLSAAMLLASYIPARRAMSISPVEALRSE